MLFAILAIAFVVRLKVADMLSKVVFDDTALYLTAGEILAKEGRFLPPGPDMEISSKTLTYYNKLLPFWDHHRRRWVLTSVLFAPVFPSFLSGIYLTSKSHVLLITSYVNILIATFTCLVIYFLAKELFNPSAGLLASLLSALTPALVVWSGFVLTEPLYIFLLSSGVLFILRSRYLVGGMVLGLAVLTRTHFLGFLPLMLIGLLLGARPGQRMVPLVHVTAGLLLVLVLWSTYVFFREKPQLETLVKHVKIRMELSLASLRAISGSGKGVSFPTFYPHRPADNLDLYHSTYMSYTTRAPDVPMPGLSAKAIWRKLRYIWALSPPERWEGKELLSPLIKLFYGLLFVTALAGLLVHRRDWRRLLVPVSFPVSFTLIYIPIYAASHFRSRAPIEPFVILFSAAFFYWLYRRSVESPISKEVGK